MPTKKKSSAKILDRSQMKMHILKTINGVHICVKAEALEASKLDGFWTPASLYFIPVKQKKL